MKIDMALRGRSSPVVAPYTRCLLKFRAATGLEEGRVRPVMAGSGKPPRLQEADAGSRSPPGGCSSPEQWRQPFGYRQVGRRLKVDPSKPISIASGGNSTTIRANYIGLSTAGTAAVANTGISVTTATGAIIGGATSSVVTAEAASR